MSIISGKRSIQTFALREKVGARINNGNRSLATG